MIEFSIETARQQRFADGKQRPNSRGGADKPESSANRRRAVLGGRKPFIIGDGNSSWYRRMKDIAMLHVGDLGGRDLLSEAQLSLIRRASTLEVELEQLEGQLSLGQEIDLDAYSRVTNTLRRVLETLGIKRVPREAGPVTVRDYLEAKASE